jgi:hypothetical protein
MTYSDLISLIENSSRSDWLKDEPRGIYVHKSDLNIRLIDSHDDKPYTAAWVKRFPDKKATSVVFELWYGSSYIKSYYFVSVDGHRAMLPFPKDEEDLVITREQYGVAQAVDLIGTADEYLRRSRFRLEESRRE